MIPICHCKAIVVKGYFVHRIYWALNQTGRKLTAFWRRWLLCNHQLSRTVELVLWRRWIRLRYRIMSSELFVEYSSRWNLCFILIYTFRFVYSNLVQISHELRNRINERKRILNFNLFSITNFLKIIFNNENFFLTTIIKWKSLNIYSSI